jgi:hypothetical protein
VDFKRQHYGYLLSFPAALNTHECDEQPFLSR